MSRLDEPIRRELLQLGGTRRYAPDEILILEGEEKNDLMLICGGLTKVTAGLPDGRTALLALRVGGDLIGEMSALNGWPRSATVTACARTEVRRIPKDDFMSFLSRNPDAALDLAAMVSDRHRWSNHRRIDFSSYPVRVRVARIIADLARTHGRWSPNGVVIDVHLTQPDLATICGAAETSVQKALREMRTEELIETDYRKLTVRNLAGLREAGMLDPDEG
ncbi:Crp/Fnr family transcriptional regulator [Micromonospora echinofusca]|nr:Crp/Fnr family transcriptional regulator [Micromonospora echinofusca]